jgi:hypothetical protein
LHWHLRPVHLWWLEELVRLREVRPNVGLLDLVFNNSDLIDHVLEVYVVCVE